MRAAALTPISAAVEVGQRAAGEAGVQRGVGLHGLAGRRGRRATGRGRSCSPTRRRRASRSRCPSASALAGKPSATTVSPCSTPEPLPSGAVAQPGGAADAQQREVLARRVADQLGRPRPAVDRDPVARALVDDVGRGDHEALAASSTQPEPVAVRRSPRSASTSRVEGASRFTTSGTLRSSSPPPTTSTSTPPRAPARRRRAPPRSRAARRACRARPSARPRTTSALRPAAAARLGGMRQHRDLDAGDLQLLAAREHRLLDPAPVDVGAVGGAEVADAQAAGRLGPQLGVVARGLLVTDDEVAALHAAEDEPPCSAGISTVRPASAPDRTLSHTAPAHMATASAPRSLRSFTCSCRGRTGWPASRRRSRAPPRGCGPACRARRAAPWTRG